MDRTELVGIWQHRADTGGARLERVEPKKRVQPNQTAAGAFEPIHLEGQFPRHLPFETVREEQNDRALAEYAARPMAVEVVKRMGDPGSALPILCALRGAGERFVRI